MHVVNVRNKSEWANIIRQEIRDGNTDYKKNEIRDIAYNLNFHLYDKVLSVDYVLAALGVIPDVPDLKKLPEFDTLVSLDSQFINSFIKGKSALSDVEHFTVQPSDGGVEFTIGYSDMNSNRISLKAQSGAVSITDPITFNANLFKEVLSANKECSKAELQISNKGLAHVEFKVDDFVAKYWLVSQQAS